MSRRPNPEEWTAPRAPYNPYDPADLRPPEGYPSEYDTPGRPRNWSRIPKDATTFQRVKESMKKSNFTPRPISQLYPGQYKVLRRKTDGGFNRGVRACARFAIVSVIVGCVFFYRWNDGYDNVFSVPYRWQLHMRQRLFENLSEKQLEDLRGKQKGMVKRTASGELSSLFTTSDHPDSAFALTRPSRGQVLEAERLRQEREEAILRAVDIAERKLEEKRKSSGKL